MHSFILASTTKNGLICTKSLLQANFTCLGVLTPPPRPVGRAQTLTPTPVQTWAEQAHLPIFPVTQKISPDLATQLPAADFLLVVDFGYYIPAWLRQFPRLLAVNVHPSALPLYRGASPGQAVILSGDQTSAVSIMTLAAAMDAGDLLTQIPFPVDPAWTTADYYQFAFQLTTKHLSTTLTDFATGKLNLTPQSGTPSFAAKLTKADAFVTQDDLHAALQGKNPSLAAQIERQIRAFAPWPLAWTQVQTSTGAKRLQLLSAHLSDNQLILDQVKLEGETAKNWRDVQQRIAFVNN